MKRVVGVFRARDSARGEGGIEEGDALKMFRVRDQKACTKGT